MNIFNWFKKATCQHEFKLKDLELTGIPTQEKPKGNDFREWSDYYANQLTDIGHTHRVKWSCHKCKKEFFAHCGLDISPKYGYIVPNENNQP